MAAKLVDVYRCPSCDKPWQDRLDATDCCDAFGDIAWACGTAHCPSDGLHETAAEANDCDNPHECECGHMKGAHALQGQWNGCYDLDCRCAAYVPAAVLV